MCRERKEDSGEEERRTSPNSSVSSPLSVHHELTDALIQSELTVRSRLLIWNIRALQGEE